MPRGGGGGGAGAAKGGGKGGKSSNSATTEKAAEISRGLALEQCLAQVRFTVVILLFTVVYCSVL